MTPSPQGAAESLRAYLDQLRRRARAQQGTVWLLALSSVTCLCVLMAAALSGPVVSPRWAWIAWSLCAVPPLVTAGLALRRLRAQRGPVAARLLRSHAPELALGLQSALELTATPAAGHSEALVAAHAARVAEQLTQVPPSRALPWSRLRRPAVGAALMGCLVGAVLMVSHPRVNGGLVALLHPAREGDDGILTAPIVSELQARIVFPSYLRRDPEPIENPDAITAPVGSTLEVKLGARLPVQEVLLVVGPQRMRLSYRDGLYQGRIVVRADAELEVQMRGDGQWYRDATVRTIRALSDHVPLVELITPRDGGWVDADQPVEVSFRASDNEGLSEVDLRVKLPDGRELRRPLWSAMDAPAPPSQLSETMAFVPLDLGVRQGDRFELWLEARDGDIVTGPNQGESVHVTLEALSHAQHLSRHLPRLKAVLDLGLVALADRLETPVPEAAEQAMKRHAKLRASEDAWLTALSDLVASLERQPTDSLGLDREQLDAIEHRFQRLRAREQQLHQRHTGSRPTRLRIDSLLVAEAETDLLLLADLLSQAHLDEANALAGELKELKARMKELLEALSESDSEEAKQALLAEIARAERRLRELMRSMAELAAQVPSEFVNQDALQEPGTSEAMEDLQASVQAGDLDAAARHLEQLEQQLDALTKGLESGGLRFREARFGPRDQALMEAREQLAMLSEEQNALAEASAEQTRQIMGRGGTPGGARGGPEDLRRMADDVDRQLSELAGQGMGTAEQRTHEQASERLQDTRAALGTGDLAEAQRMAAASQRAMEQLARNLENDARMFQGHDGRAGERADRAREVSEDMQDLQDAISRRTPQLSEQMNAEDRQQMQQQAERQRRLREAASKLRDSLSEGPQGLPLSPEGADAVRRAQDAMRRAERQLERTDLQEASMTQEEAADQLRQLSEELARKQSGQAQGEGGGEGDGDVNGRVRIPDADDFEAPTARRRRILDAMREGSPPGFATAVDEYYRELLR